MYIKFDLEKGYHDTRDLTLRMIDELYLAHKDRIRVSYMSPECGQLSDQLSVFVVVMQQCINISH